MVKGSIRTITGMNVKEVTRSMATHNRRFAVMVEGTDEGRSFFASFEVCAESISRVRELLLNEANSSQWVFERIEEIMPMESASEASEECIQTSGRSYFGDDA